MGVDDMQLRRYLRYYERLAASAARRGIDFLVSVDTGWKLFLHQNGRCALTGLPIDFGDSYHSASLDRIDSYKPYVPHNVQWVYAPINLMKGRSSVTEFTQLCRLVAEHQTETYFSK